MTTKVRNSSFFTFNTQKLDFRGPALDEEVQIGEDVKHELQTKRTIIDKNTGKVVEVDIYERAQPKKKVDPTK